MNAYGSTDQMDTCDLERADIEEMLSCLDPNMEYTDWLKTLIAIHDWDSGQLGVDVADQWSAGSEKYQAGEVGRKFRTFIRKSDAPSVGWLVSAAKRRGYMPGRRSGGAVRRPTHRSEASVKHEETETERARLAKWLKDAGDEMYSASEKLFSRDGANGQMYLASRGISEETALRFWIGYRSDVPIPGTKGMQTAPAIVLPWTHNKKTVALRYRFIDGHGDDRLVSKQRAHDNHFPFSGRLFGGFGMGEERQRWLVLVEGEINCMSIWQAAHHAGIDVLSYGSETSKMPSGLANFASGYATVLVWADKREVAERLMAEIPGAVGIQSPERDGKKVDANDMLIDGTLGLFLAAVRDVAARDDDERRWLLRELLQSSKWYGIDTAMAELCVDLGDRLGEYVSLREERGAWVSEEIDNER